MDKRKEALEVFERAYLAILKLPHDLIRIQNQKMYCDLRDRIASETGCSAEYIQNKFEGDAVTREDTGINDKLAKSKPAVDITSPALSQPDPSVLVAALDVAVVDLTFLDAAIKGNDAREELAFRVSDIRRTVCKALAAWKGGAE